ncbi:cytochrome b/b6 domain-containing protein [Thermodesulfatator autotrophicus]|uniref:Cytochrome B n=1 Tax=Thermodesulfatator autotrophicus TaxID=1795632 RepID=A0A177E9Y0_9BACT|nr:cytochrome b/b6 domain-containing protein [Thermodesulfatator autotrophicus]OAG28754.1 cytochrome B [Thermodesulfatator autotrophicus]
MKERLYLYTRFERFWHWTQALLIIFLLLTGFEMHGTISIWGYEKAYIWHVYAGFALIVLTAFGIFWHFTTGAWQHYVPVKEKISQIIHYYTRGIFYGEPHPFEKRPDQKLNPLQRVAYLFLKVILFPLQLLTAFLLLFYEWWPHLGINLNLQQVALYHTAGAFAFLFFLIVHVYLSTTGKPWYSHLKGMFLGWEEIEKN